MLASHSAKVNGWCEGRKSLEGEAEKEGVWSVQQQPIATPVNLQGPIFCCTSGPHSKSAIDTLCQSISAVKAQEIFVARLGRTAHYLSVSLPRFFFIGVGVCGSCDLAFSHMT